MSNKDSNQQQEVQQDSVQEQNVQEQSLQDTASSTDEMSKKKNGKKAITGIIILFLVLALGAGGAYLYLNNGLKSNPKTNKTENDSKDFYSTYRMSGNSLEKFDIEFLKLENSEKNKVYSPLSIKYALQMLSDGTSGKTKQQIDAIVGDYKPVKYANNEHMSFANAMFIRNEFAKNINDSYKKTLSDKYNAEIFNDSFENASPINNWVSEKTFKLINGLVDDDTIKQLNFVLVNALAIDMNWNNQIQCESVEGNTGDNKVPCMPYHVNYAHERYAEYVSYIMSPAEIKTMNFNGKENTKVYEIGASFNNYDIVKELGRDEIYKTISSEYTEWLKSDEAKQAYEVEPDVDKFTNKFIEELDSNYKSEDYSTDFLVYDDENVKAFGKDLKEYDGITLQYVGIMPKNGSLTDYVNNVNTDSLKGVISGLKDMKRENFKDGVVTKIVGKIPVFDYEYELNLKEDLQKMGVSDVFDITKADLSGMIKENSEKQYIEKAIHKANIAFSNQGIKAAAATALGGAGSTTGPHFEHLFDVPVEEIDMTFDKPYMFVIRDKNSGEIWFTGTVYEPLTK